MGTPGQELLLQPRHGPKCGGPRPARGVVAAPLGSVGQGGKEPVTWTVVYVPFSVLRAVLTHPLLHLSFPHDRRAVVRSPDLTAAAGALLSVAAPLSSCSCSDVKALTGLLSTRPVLSVTQGAFSGPVFRCALAGL